MQNCKCGHHDIQHNKDGVCMECDCVKLIPEPVNTITVLVVGKCGVCGYNAEAPMEAKIEGTIKIQNTNILTPVVFTLDVCRNCGASFFRRS